MTTTPSSFILDVQGQPFPLYYGASFTRDQFPMLVPSAGSGPVAQVSANPNDPSQLGLQNLTAQPWVAVMPDGSQQQVEPSRSARLIAGVTLQMGGVQTQIRAAQAPAPAGIAPPAFTPPAFGQPQPQAPQFGQPQQQAPAFGQPQTGQASFTPPAFGQPQQPPPFGQPQASPFGQQQPGGAWPPPAGGPAGGVYMGQNDSGTGKTAVLPPQLQGFNVGAFLLNFIWAIGNQTWIGLLSLVPYVGFIMAIVLGVKGNEWAWQNRRWESIEQFQEVQKKWTKAALIVLVASIVVGIVGGILFGIVAAHIPAQPQQ